MLYFTQKRYSNLAHLANSIKHILINVPLFSVPGCPRDDLHWLRLPHDFPQEIRTLSRLAQHDVRCYIAAVGNPRHWVLPYAL